MKKLLLLLLFLSSNLFALYNTPGTGKSWTLDSLVAFSSGHVTISGGSYFVNDTLTISVSDTLKIFTNSTIKLASLSLINVDGTLISRPSSQVLFTAQDTTQKYLGFRFSDFSGASVLKRTTIEYGCGLKIVNASILIDSCILRWNTLNSTFSSGAINLTNSNSIIANNSLYRNGRSAISSAGNLQSSPVIINNLIYENGVFNTQPYPQINLGGSSSQPLIIRNNIILGLYSQAGGIAIFPVGVSVPNCIIEGNVIKRNSYGIVLYNTPINALVINNIIDSNNINPNPMAAGSGINVFGNLQNTPIIARNKIRGNLWGITIQGTALPRLGNLNSPDTADKGRNEIYGNGHSDSVIDLYNNTPDSIYAQNNWWGSANPDTIERHIVHKPDLPSLGFVNYVPFLTGVSGIFSEGNIITASFRLHDAYPNPFNPATRIKFEIPTGGLHPVSLRIYDLLGRMISVLYEGQLKQGVYEVLWDAGNLPSGVYFCRLQSGSFEESKRLILVK